MKKIRSKINNLIINLYYYIFSINYNWDAIGAWIILLTVIYLFICLQKLKNVNVKVHFKMNNMEKEKEFITLEKKIQFVLFVVLKNQKQNKNGKYTKL